MNTLRVTIKDGKEFERICQCLKGMKTLFPYVSSPTQESRWWRIIDIQRGELIKPEYKLQNESWFLSAMTTLRLIIKWEEENKQSMDRAFLYHISTGRPDDWLKKDGDFKSAVIEIGYDKADEQTLLSIIHNKPLTLPVFSNNILPPLMLPNG